MKKRIFPIIKAAISISTLPLWFVKMFRRVGHLPTESGEIVERIFRHSMFENLTDVDFSVLPYAAMALAVISAVFNLLLLIIPRKKWATILSNILFGVAVGVFIVLQLMASTVARGY